PPRCGASEVGDRPLGRCAVSPRRGLQHAPRAQAARADEEPLPAAAHRGVHLLEVRPPEPLRLVVGMAHVVADGALLAADVARARHWVARVARRPGRCNARACGEPAGGATYPGCGGTALPWTSRGRAGGARLTRRGQ